MTEDRIRELEQRIARLEGQVGELENIVTQSEDVRAAAAVAIGVACLGAFSLTALAAARRRKEIGIRKVVGATTRQVVAVFTGKFAKLVVPGCLVAVPLSYLALDRWLQEFAYRVEPGLIHFATAGVVVTALVLAVVTSQAMRAGLANPTDLLRHD